METQVKQYKLGGETMYTGTIQSQVSLQMLDLKWQKKKQDINSKKDTEGMTQDEILLDSLERQAQTERERSATSELYTKLKTGGTLTEEEIAYLKEHDLMNYADLKKKTQAATEQFHALSAQIKSAEARMAEIAALRGHIVNFAKTKKIFDAYKASGYAKKFLAEHEAEILLHRSAKRAFQELNVKKLPTVKSLQEEYAKLLSGKRRRMPNTSVRAMRCASCCSTSRTWIVCWAKTSARRRRKRSMTGNNGHASKRFCETLSRASCAFKGGRCP